MSQGGVLTTASAGASGLDTLTGNSGGAVSGDISANIDILGSGGVVVTGNPGTNTLTITAAGAFTWNDVVATSASIAVANGYMSNNAGLVTLTLPVTAAFGDEIEIQGFGVGGWLVAQNASQIIHFGVTDSTVGITGSLASTDQYDSISLLCTVANLEFTVRASIGNISIV